MQTPIFPGPRRNGRQAWQPWRPQERAGRHLLHLRIRSQTRKGTIAVGRLFAIASCILATSSGFAASPAYDWHSAARELPPMTVPQTKAFVRRLTEFAVKHHMKTAADSPQRGMMYEYFWVDKAGTPQQWIQGEALDTMHDGAWFACAMVNAYRATGDTYYKDVLTKWQLPFYLKMLNHGDELFTNERNDAHPDQKALWTNSPEWLLQGREKGFVPYWWDDGASVSLERLSRRRAEPFFPSRDELSGKPNPDYQLSGYSHGSSNHLAQDLGCMLQLAWLLLQNSDDESDRAMAAQVATAAQRLQECRTRHGASGIPAVLAADGLANRSADRLRRIPEENWKSILASQGHYARAHAAKAGQKVTTPGFADDQQYRYYAHLARTGTMTEPMAFRVMSDAYTEAILFDAYFDDEKRPPGINRFDLYPFAYVNGKPEHRRSERKGPSRGPVPVGSRMGPQTMICCGWALQSLRAFPKAWEQGLAEAKASGVDPATRGWTAADGTPLSRDQLEAWHVRELSGGLRTWESIMDEHGYIPTGIGCQSVMAGTKWDAFSDNGGYAHLISAASQWILYLENRTDWAAHQIPSVLP